MAQTKVNRMILNYTKQQNMTGIGFKQRDREQIKTDATIKKFSKLLNDPHFCTGDNAAKIVRELCGNKDSKTLARNADDIYKFIVEQILHKVYSKASELQLKEYFDILKQILIKNNNEIKFTIPGDGARVEYHITINNDTVDLSAKTILDKVIKQTDGRNIKEWINHEKFNLADITGNRSLFNMYLKPVVDFLRENRGVLSVFQLGK